MKMLASSMAEEELAWEDGLTGGLSKSRSWMAIAGWEGTSQPSRYMELR
jgi:hypothetical protein